MPQERFDLRRCSTLTLTNRSDITEPRQKQLLSGQKFNKLQNESDPEDKISS